VVPIASGTIAPQVVQPCHRTGDYYPGLGVPDDELPHIFDELYRGQEARGIEGSGLGLALVKAVVERHGGDVTTRSRPGRGVCSARGCRQARGQFDAECLQRCLRG
jgi:hypothetical protein